MTAGARFALAVLTAAASLVGPAAAQRPHRTGLWFEIGSGPAHLRVACAGCDDVTTSSGASGYIRIGGVISDKVLLGIESFGFGQDSIGCGGGTVTVDVLWFPWRSGAFLKGGVGAAGGAFTVIDSTGTLVEAQGEGIGLALGLGWDVPISRKFALTAHASAYITGIGDVVLPTVTVDDVIATMYHITLGFTFR